MLAFLLFSRTLFVLLCVIVQHLLPGFLKTSTNKMSVAAESKVAADDWKSNLSLPPKDRRFRTAVSHIIILKACAYV